MHYFIDGYNMLFRTNQSFKDLQTERELLLQELNQKAFLLNLNISVIFDAAYRAGERNRSHLHALEIIYTAERETADEYLIDMTCQMSQPRHIVVVTNDKILASKLRHSSVKIETIEYFKQWLNRSYAKRLNGPKEKKKPLISLISHPILLKVEELAPKIIQEPELEYYQRVFEKEHEALKKLEKIKKRPVKKVRKPKKIEDPFDPPRLIKEEATEMERWLKAFEKNLEGL